MELQHRQHHLLHDFEEFEREFLPPYDPQNEAHLRLENDIIRPSWLEEMERAFVRDQLKFPSVLDPSTPKKLKITSEFPNQLNQNNDTDHSVILGSLDSNSVVPNDPKIAYLSETSPSPRMLEELINNLANQENDTNGLTNIESRPSNVLTRSHTEYTYPTNEENIIDLMNLEDIAEFDFSVLDLIDFDIPTDPNLDIDNRTYINKATNQYGEEFAKKVENNLWIFREAMKRTSRCCNGGERVEKGICCNGKCWRHIESKLKALQKIPRGRKKKGFELTPQELVLKKERQKIRNRISAAAAYKKEKAYIVYLEGQVKEYRAENKIRKNLIKGLGEGRLRTIYTRTPFKGSIINAACEATFSSQIEVALPTQFGNNLFVITNKDKVVYWRTSNPLNSTLSRWVPLNGIGVIECDSFYQNPISAS